MRWSKQIQQQHNQVSAVHTFTSRWNFGKHIWTTHKKRHKQNLAIRTSICHHFTHLHMCDMLSIRPVKHLDTVAFICRPIAVCVCVCVCCAVRICCCSVFSTNLHYTVSDDIRMRMLCIHAANFKFALHKYWKFMEISNGTDVVLFHNVKTQTAVSVAIPNSFFYWFILILMNNFRSSFCLDFKMRKQID